jgi:hypothetical protein
MSSENLKQAAKKSIKHQNIKNRKTPCMLNEYPGLDETGCHLPYLHRPVRRVP